MTIKRCLAIYGHTGRQGESARRPVRWQRARGHAAAASSHVRCRIFSSPHLLISNASCPMPHSSPKSGAPGPARAPPRPRPRRRASTGPKNPNAAERKVCSAIGTNAGRGPSADRRRRGSPRSQKSGAKPRRSGRPSGAVSGAETTPEAAATNAAATIGSSLSFKSASNGPERPPPEEAGRWRGRVPVLWPHVLRAHAAVLGTCQSTRARRPIASKSW